MLFIKLPHDDSTLEGIEQICQTLIQHPKILENLDQKTLDDLSAILKPTLAADQNEDEKRQHWQNLLNEFVATDRKGNLLRFYRQADTGKLFFGDQAGFDLANEMAKPKPNHPQN